jgi:hypothetical protein
MLLVHPGSLVVTIFCTHYKSRPLRVRYTMKANELWRDRAYISVSRGERSSNSHGGLQHEGSENNVSSGSLCDHADTP